MVYELCSSFFVLYCSKEIFGGDVFSVFFVTTNDSISPNIFGSRRAFLSAFFCTKNVAVYFLSINGSIFGFDVGDIGRLVWLFLKTVAVF